MRYSVFNLAKEVLNSQGYEESILKEPYLWENLQQLCAEKEHVSRNDVESRISICFYHAKDYSWVDFNAYHKTEATQSTNQKARGRK